jgi:glyoxylase-like metal-dependent hydrolase (beta-lactamase superfamily II)
MPLQRWSIGDVAVTRVVEVEGPMPGTFILPDATPDNVRAHAWLRPHFADEDGSFIGSIHAFVLESCGRRIVVDTCVGNDKVRQNAAWNQLQTRFLDDLAEAGYPPHTIDVVLCTHLHVDHVGWNTMLVDGRWVPTFANARYLFARDEWAHWSREQGTEEAVVVEDSVRPIVDAGRCDLVEMTHRVTDEVWLEPTTGHTPGHVSVRISSRGEDAVITGDMMHHPVQCAEPDWTSHFDFSQDAARATRRAFLTRYADKPVTVFGTHFATPTAGHIVSHGTTWRFRPRGA